MQMPTKWVQIPIVSVVLVLVFAAIAAALPPKQQPLRRCACTCTFIHMGQQYSGTLNEFNAESCAILSIGQVSGAPHDYCRSADGTMRDDYVVKKCEDKGPAAVTAPTVSPNVGTLPKLTPGTAPVTPPTTPPTTPPITPSR